MTSTKRVIDNSRISSIPSKFFFHSKTSKIRSHLFEWHRKWSMLNFFFIPLVVERFSPFPIKSEFQINHAYRQKFSHPGRTLPKLEWYPQAGRWTFLNRLRNVRWSQIYCGAFNDNFDELQTARQHNIPLIYYIWKVYKWKSENWLMGGTKMYQYVLITFCHHRLANI